MSIGIDADEHALWFGHDFESMLAEQFDAMIWIEQTTPLTALPLPKSQQVEPEDETYPFGV